MRGRRRVVVPLALASLLAGCTLLATLEDHGTTGADADAGPDAGAGLDAGSAAQCDGASVDLATDPQNCGACGHACANDEACGEGACTPGCADRVIYVATSGNDTNRGCRRNDPKRTISGAIGYASVVKAERHEIHVCAGIYVETDGVALEYPVSLRGGYECTTWKRADDFGLPAFSNRTVIEALSESQTPLRIAGAAVDANVFVEGFQIGQTEADRRVAVLVRGTAGPVLSDLDIRGGTSKKAPTAGLVIQEGAHPKVQRVQVDGGRGYAAALTGYGSVGVFVVSDSGAVLIEASKILGGSGTSDGVVGSASVLIGGGPTTLRGNVILGGDGTVTIPGAVASVGVLGQTSAGGLEIVGNTIQGGMGRCGSLACEVDGIITQSAGPYQISKNLIFGGAAPNASSTVRGVRVQGTATIADNMIYAGNAQNADLASAQGVLLNTGSGAKIVHNTIVAAPRGTSIANLSFAVGLGLPGMYTAATIDGNLLVGPIANMRGIFLSSCAGSTIASLHDNGFVNLNDGLLRHNTCALADDKKTIKELDMTLGTAISAGNFRVTAGTACNAGETPDQCWKPPAPCDAGCTEQVVAWDGKVGLTNWVAGGYHLLDNAPCQITRGGGAPIALATDFFDAGRTDATSMGAHENDSDLCVP